MPTRALAALACIAPGLSLSLPAQSPQLDSIGRYVAEVMNRQQIPGLSVAVLRGDRILLARGYGFANLEHRVPATDSTIYQSGSLGKQFTAGWVPTWLGSVTPGELETPSQSWSPSITPALGRRRTSISSTTDLHRDIFNSNGAAR